MQVNLYPSSVFGCNGNVISLMGGQSDRLVGRQIVTNFEVARATIIQNLLKFMCCVDFMLQLFLNNISRLSRALRMQSCYCLNWHIYSNSHTVEVNAIVANWKSSVAIKCQYNNNIYFESDDYWLALEYYNLFSYHSGTTKGQSSLCS